MLLPRIADKPVIAIVFGGIDAHPRRGLVVFSRRERFARPPKSDVDWP